MGRLTFTGAEHPRVEIDIEEARNMDEATRQDISALLYNTAPDAVLRAFDVYCAQAEAVSFLDFLMAAAVRYVAALEQLVQAQAALDTLLTVALSMTGPSMPQATPTEGYDDDEQQDSDSPPEAPQTGLHSGASRLE